MKMLKRYMLAVVIFTIAITLLINVNGCKKSDNASSRAGQVYAASVELCTDCGQIKGSELCCEPNQPKCDACSLAKGSPGCCNIPESTEKAAICTMCGQIKGSELCYKPDQLKCASCGLVKDSPGCCRL